MIIGIGIDLEEVDRIGASIEKFGDRFLDRVFTPGEIEFCRGKANTAERFAARFAAKEAAFKALQATWTGNLTWRDFETRIQTGGAPILVLHGGAAELAAIKQVQKAHVSFSHTKQYVTAVVILED